MNFKAFITFLSQYYERVIAVVVMLLLVVFSVILVFRISDLQNRIKKEDESRSAGAEPGILDASKLKKSLTLLENPPSWTSPNTNHQLFIAPYMKVLNPSMGFPERYNQGIEKIARSSEGLPFSWLRRYGLSTKNPVADLDMDGDGFTNREEYLAGTDPTDSNSKPDVALKLRVIQVLQKQFPFIFNSIVEDSGGIKFGLLRVDGRKSYFVKVGEVVPDKDSPGWKIVDYNEKYLETTNPTIKGPDGKFITQKVDITELILQKEGETPLVLVKYKPSFMDELFVRLYFVLEKRSFDVGIGDVFTLQNIPYRVFSIKKLDDNKSEVIMERQDSGKQFPLMALPQDSQKIQTPTSQGFQP